jgi:hypothetical protein
MLKLSPKSNIRDYSWKYNLVFSFEIALFEVTKLLTEQGETI